MNTVAGITHFPQLLLLLLVSVVSSQSYPRFEFRGAVLKNNSFVFRGSIGAGQDESLRCVTDNSECCTNESEMSGSWHYEGGDQGPNRNSELYVTRVVYLNRRTGGSVGLWRCDVPDSSGVQQSIYIYLGTSETGIHYTL